MKKYLSMTLAVTFCGVAIAQEPDRLTVPFSDPARPKTVRISLLHGSITVKGYEGRDVIVEGSPGRNDRRGDAPAGLRRIPMSSSGLEAEEENNIIRINASSHSRHVDLTVQVPR